LILFSYQQNADFPLIVAANRDEFYARPTAALDWWADAPDILGGADISQPSRGGWLAVNRQGRFAAVTNFRGATEVRGSAAAKDDIGAAHHEPGKDSKSAKSRGLIVRRFLHDGVTMPEFIRELTQSAREYNGNNLLFGSARELWHFNNRSGEPPAPIEPGLHALSNATLNSPWPKALLSKQLFGELAGNPPLAQDVFAMLANPKQADAQSVQRTGLPLKYEIALSSIFIALEIRRGLFRRKVGYGTRVSSYVTFSKTGRINFSERTYQKGQMQSDRFFVHET